MADRSIQVAIALGVMSLIIALVAIPVGIGKLSRKGHVLASGGSPWEAFEAEVLAKLAAAQQHQRQESWKAAALGFRLVLELDPIHPVARDGLEQAEINSDHQGLLAAARQRINAGKPSEALGELYQIPGEAHYGERAAELMREATERVTEEALATARSHCSNSEWVKCHAQAVRCLEATSNSVSGQALVSAAESAMRAQRITFTPWSPPEHQARGTEHSLQERYEDPEVRQAALRYAVGDLETAIRRARMYARRAGALELNAKLVAFRRAKTRGDGAAIAGDYALAVKAWQEALTEDGRMLPADSPSALRTEIQGKLGRELFRAGKGAFNRAAYGEAFRIWQRARSYLPQNSQVQNGLAQLEERAKALLDALPKGHPSPPSCVRLSEIRSMTAAGSGIHQAAHKRGLRCKSP